MQLENKEDFYNRLELFNTMTKKKCLKVQFLAQAQLRKEREVRYNLLEYAVPPDSCPFTSPEIGVIIC